MTTSQKRQCHVNKYTEDLTADGLRQSMIAARILLRHLQMPLMRQTDHETGVTASPFKQYVDLSPLVRGSFKPLILEDLTVCRCCWKKESYFFFKTPSVNPSRNRTQASHTVDWHLTNQANLNVKQSYIQNSEDKNAISSFFLF